MSSHSFVGIPMSKKNTVIEWKRRGDCHNFLVDGHRKASLVARGRGFRGGRCECCGDYWPACPRTDGRIDHTKEYFILHMSGSAPKKFNSINLAKEYIAHRFV